MAVAAWQISKEHNVGSLVRTAHAVAAAQVLLVGDKEYNVTAARTAELYTTVLHLEDEHQLLEHIATQGWQLVAIETDARAESMFDVSYPPRPCFLLGAELGGIPESLLDKAELIVRIPQWGLIPSLNLAIAGSLVMYDYLAKCARAGRLDRPNGGIADSN